MGEFRHKWKVAVSRVDEAVATALDFGVNPLSGERYFSAWIFAQPGKSAVGRTYAVTVGDGCVNDAPAAIEYLAKGDPRGWELPPDYAPYAALQRIYGRDYKFADRPLWEDPAPYLLLTAPSADGADLGGFTKTPDARRPPFFRTAEAWERELYQASVIVSSAPFRADPLAVSLATAGPRAVRWRVTAGKTPQAAADRGVTKFAARELARVWLLRTPGKPEDDEVHVQQLEYWNLRARSAVDTALLELMGFTAEVLAAEDIALLAFGLTGVTLGTVLVGLEAAVVNLLLDNLAAILAATSDVEFWSV